MAVAQSGAFLKDLRTLYAEGSIGTLTDGQLLERFVACRDEVVFEALVERHGTMVLQICRGMLGNSHDAEDVFQATFLVLVRRAGSIRKRDSVASWLFGVAGRIAARARVDAARRRKHERRAAEMATRSDVHEERPDLGSVLREEVARLPEKYREVVVLCYLEGQTYEAAARRLGRPVGTVKVRLSRARALLLGRLTRRGLGLPAGMAALGTTAEAAALVPPALVRATVQAVLRPSASAAARLATRTLRSMMMTRTLGVVAVLLSAGFVTLGAGVFIPGMPTKVVAWIVPHRAQAAPPVLGATAVGLVGQGQYGTIKGRLVWGGDQLPPVKVLAEKGKAAKDPEVYARNQPILSRELAVDPATKGLPYGFAYLSRPTGSNPEAVQDLISKHPKAELDQQNCEFLPYVLPIHQDQTLVVKSSDPTNHNVRLTPYRNSPINQTLAPKGQIEIKLVAEPLPIKVDCDIHSWTHGWIMVFDHTFFAVTGKDGTFEIKGVPAGSQNLVLWQENVGYVTPGGRRGMAVEVKPGGVTDVGEIKLDPKKVKPVS
jgi:RNA polymerase sigma factor (sigma-70 family)